MLLLTESQMLDPRTGVHFAWHDTLLYLSGTPHTHEYFELFLMAEGRLLHRIQDKILPLAEGELVFIRPSDVHTYESAGDAPPGSLTWRSPAKWWPTCSSTWDWIRRLIPCSPPRCLLPGGSMMSAGRSLSAGWSG
ncbi:AraC family ligand binding domain-containing protein [Paenibacillus sp. CC-CFT747]|nr:AraC family ligand binding domain-containing protein [Paenibacillus sp. CC-CFT747]